MRFADALAGLGGVSGSGDGHFDPRLVADLPQPARRMLQRAIPSGAALARRTMLELSGEMTANGRRMAVTARELLVPGRGFAWEARAALGPLWLRVRDHYLDGDGAVDVRLLGVVPLGAERGQDVATSSRGRLAAESFWAPTTLLPQAGARWTAVDDQKATVHVSIDGHEESVTFAVDDDGALTEVTMLRWGDVQVQEHQRIPYGFGVVEERTFEGYTIASTLRGGWWYGTDRYRPDEASTFEVQRARYA